MGWVEILICFYIGGFSGWVLWEVAPKVWNFIWSIFP